MMYRIFPLLGLLALGACVVGPDYAGAPDLAVPSRFHRATGGDGVQQLPVVTQAQWWTRLDDPKLDHLVEQALAGSADIDAAQARLVQARAMVKRRRAEQMPEGDTSASYQRTKPSFAYLGQTLPGISPQDIDLYDLRYDASWEIDLFGAKRRRLEASLADAGALAAELEDTRLRIAAETVQAYIALRGGQQRLVLNRQMVDAEARLLELTLDRRSLGAASDFDVDRVSAQLDRTRAVLPGIEQEVAMAQDRLAVLTGQFPGALDEQLADIRSIPAVPGNVALGDPAELLRRRPDIRAAERQLAGANARIGAAIADQFPKISLLGVVGLSANTASGLSDGFTYGVGPSLRWRFPDFGGTAAGVDMARARHDEALAQYRGTVLDALRDAEQAIMRYAGTAEEERLGARTKASTTHAGEMALFRYEEGSVSLIEVLDAERERLRASLTLNEVQEKRAASFVELHKSLGLGWQLPEGQSAQK